MGELINKEEKLICKERNYWLDNAKFFLILLVVMGHFIGGFRKFYFIKYLYTFLCLFHMPMFMFITGYFSKKLENTKNKVIKFSILYLIMQGIEIIISGANFSILRAQYGLWYLQVIVIYNLILPIINREKPIKSLIIAIILGLVIGFDNNAASIASLSRIFTMLPFFVMGYITNEKTLNKLKNKKVIAVAIIVLILVAIFIPYIIKNIPKYDDILLGKSSYKQMKMEDVGVFYRAGWYALSIILFLSILSIIPKRKIPCISKFGSRTLQVYCLQNVLSIIFKQTILYKQINTEKECVYLLLGTVLLTVILSTKLFSYPFDFFMKNQINSIYKNIKQRIIKEKC